MAARSLLKSHCAAPFRPRTTDAERLRDEYPTWRNGEPNEANKKTEIDSMKRIAVTTALVGTIALAGAIVANAGVNDSWITTKAKIALLTSDGFSVNGANVDTIDGKVTLHGKVGTSADRTKAEQTVRKVEGVKSVNNQLQVVPDEVKDMVAGNDSELKGRVEASLKADSKMDDVKVASVNNGVVLLSGKTGNLTDKLRAIENAYSVDGVRRVATEIRAIEN